jgi:hypothetical protein
MPTDPPQTRRRYLRSVISGSLVGIGGCSGNLTENETVADSPPTENASDEHNTPTEEPQAVRLSPVDDPRELRSTGLTAIYPTDLIGWLQDVTSHDRTVRKRVSTGQEMPNPPLRMLGRVRFVEPPDAPYLDDADSITGYYELDVEAGPYYEMHLNAEPATPPSDAVVTPVADLDTEHREFVIAAIEDDTEGSRVASDTALARWVRESFVDTYYRYEGETYRGYEVQRTDAGSASTEAWYTLSASPSREYDDATYLLSPGLVDTVRAELDAVGLRERADGIVVEDPSQSLVAFADQMAMLVTHITIFRIRVETR